MTLAALRADLAADLTAAGVYTYAYPAQADSAPCALVVPGYPFIEAADRFGVHVVRFDLWVLVEDDVDEQLDQMVSLVVETLVEDYDIERIEIAPSVDTNSVVNGAKITLTTEVARKELGN
jgi:hypothetical protein